MRIKLILLIAFTSMLCNITSGQNNRPLTKADSILVLKKIYMYNFDDKVFDDIDEPFLEELWESNKPKAKELFAKAIKLSTAPIHERLILASYFYHDGDLKKVKQTINTCRTKKDTIVVLGVMDSYDIKYSDFNIKPEVVQFYCKDCKYK